MRIGLIGCGRWGKNHAKHLSELACDFVGIADPDTKTREVADQHKVAYFQDPGALVDKIDSCVVVAPTNLHYMIVKDALSKGKHVFVEKPAAETPEEISDLIGLASERNLVLNTGYLFRFNPAVKELKKRLQEAGQIRYIEAKNVHEREARRDSGVIINLGVHPLDTLLFLTEERPYGLVCMTTGSPGVEKAAILTLNYGSYIAIVETACEAHGLVEKVIKVVGEYATFEVDFLEQTLTKYVQGSQPYTWSPKEKEDLLRIELQNFLDCCSSGNLRNIGREDLITAKICDYALQSARQRKWVSIYE